MHNFSSLINKFLKYTFGKKYEWKKHMLRSKLLFIFIQNFIACQKYGFLGQHPVELFNTVGFFNGESSANKRALDPLLI